jgi:hypothetical protein
MKRNSYLPVRIIFIQKKKRYVILSKPVNLMRKKYVKVSCRAREEFIAV